MSNEDDKDLLDGPLPDGVIRITSHTLRGCKVTLFRREEDPQLYDALLGALEERRAKREASDARKR